MVITLGLDFGTSGARAIVLDHQGTPVAHARVDWSQTPNADLPHLWLDSLEALVAAIPQTWRSSLGRIAINGTSGTVLLCDAQGHSLTEPLLYDDDRGKTLHQPPLVTAPSDHLVQGSTSSFRKLLWWAEQFHWADTGVPEGIQLLHQADWLAQSLHHRRGVTDYHNALKLGYDVANLTYPDWLGRSPLAPLLPPVLPPGQPIAPIAQTLSQRWHIPPQCQICAGTTDSIAAFLASGLQKPGDAVTSLGSTLVLKLLSDRPVNDLATGIYSHRLGNLWLVGGASNTGGAVLAHFFTPDQLQTLSDRLNPEQDTGLQYYPLLKPGERFPIQDPQLLPRLDPRPPDDRQFLQGLLEGMARIEAQGYTALHAQGATPLTQVLTAGGGAKNATWIRIRTRYLGVPVAPAPHTEAALGTASLAQNFSLTH